MATARDLLHRFRPAGAPGAASATGVPVDRGADLEAELRPLFDRLTVTERECALIVEHAQTIADRVRAGAIDRARAVVVAARERVDGERADVAAQARRRGEEESAAMLATASDEAAQVRRMAGERLPSQVEAVLAAVEALIDGRSPARPPPTSGPGPGSGYGPGGGSAAGAGVA
jgi:hypothetical protein